MWEENEFIERDFKKCGIRLEVIYLIWGHWKWDPAD